MHKFGCAGLGRLTGMPRNIVNNLFTIAYVEYRIIELWRQAQIGDLRSSPVGSAIAAHYIQ